LTASWFARLLAAGLSLGAVISVKYVGAFSVALIGLHTIRELWLKWSNLDVPMSAVAEHFAAYAVGLIVVPLCLYLGLFALHLHLLPLSGTGDTFMSPDFQASLQGNTMARRQEVLRDVHTGSLVMLMNEAHGNCWLHSHPYRYPIYPSGDENGLVSSYQQQVTCLELLGADEANWFRIEDATLPFNSSESAAAAPRPLRHSDLIRLVHVTTGFALNSHDVAGPLTPQAQEVSCYGPGDERVPAGEPGHMPLSDMWRVELLGSNVDSNAPVWAIESRLRLTHISTSSALQITNKRLPDWGFGQLEVVTSRHALQSPESVWRVDDHWHPNATHKDPTIVRPRMSFWEQLIELHVEMFKANNNLLVRCTAMGCAIDASE
jgi:dolichyl-phosphate-mannose-protein mannosyltransferase